MAKFSVNQKVLVKIPHAGYTYTKGFIYKINKDGSYDVSIDGLDGGLYGDMYEEEIFASEQDLPTYRRIFPKVI